MKEHGGITIMTVAGVLEFIRSLKYNMLKTKFLTLPVSLY
jgi:hypothetical protein